MNPDNNQCWPATVAVQSTKIIATKTQLKISKTLVNKEKVLIL
jgi:hypothetical protein